MREARNRGGAGYRVDAVFRDPDGVRAWLHRSAATRRLGALVMKLSDFSALSFDCYGTLIDWESGIVTRPGALARRRAGVDLSA